MIGFPHALLVEFVLLPQSVAPVDEEFRAYLDVDEQPIDVPPQALTVLDVTTSPVAFEIGDTFEVLHRIDVGLSVQHGDLSEAFRIRDKIALQLVARADATAGDLMAADDPEGEQSIIRVRWQIDYRPLTASDDSVAEAVIEFSIGADVSRPQV